MYVSELYGKKIISVSGSILGDVKEVVLDLEEGTVAHLLLQKMESLAKSPNVRQELAKNRILYDRVKSVAETIIVGNK
ncbi:MAG: PRC-barrel domain-containing protein [Candidatus Micrarchaeota archaeon]|nr:PRC-barrel domain-containing protein [Candidatus Micrarchaeota archaeon]MDE1804951.1 PRC-barrel domain-containing protein [Candidatus Micrarchaeota archaeon]MDE1846814.1 PRC-barrel domain-containing protein [Candidatus Micrarchaeota archaeon]